MTLTEAELIAAALAGDQDAFSEIYRQHHSKVIGVAKAILRKEWGRAEDIAQDVWLKVFRGLGTFEAGSQLKSWIVRITINECFIALRRDKRRLNSGNRSHVSIEKISDEGTAVEWLGRDDPALANVDRQLDLAQLFAEVSQVDRQMLTMRYLDGLTEKEMAAALGISFMAAKGKSERAKRRARERCGSPSRFLQVAY